MVEALRRLRLEIDSIRSTLRSDSRRLVTDEKTIDRIQQLFLGWSTNVRPRLSNSRVPAEVVMRADSVFAELVRLSARRSRKQRYLAVLGALRRILVEQVLLEVAKAGAASQAVTPGAVSEKLVPEVSDLDNQLIPNALYGWIPNMRAFLRQYTYDRNVFIMVSYRKRLKPLIEGIKAELVQAGLNAIVAKEHGLTDDLYNPVACLLCCSHGLAIFDRPEKKQVHNPNVTYELGVMHLLKRPLLILKHQSVKAMPSDFLQKLYQDYSSNSNAFELVRVWAQSLTRRET